MGTVCAEEGAGGGGAHSTHGADEGSGEDAPGHDGDDHSNSHSDQSSGEKKAVKAAHQSQPLLSVLLLMLCTNLLSKIFI